MARSVQIIDQQIKDSVAADPVLGPVLTSDSRRSIWGLFAFIIASAIAALEQLMDLNITDAETIAASAAPDSAAWLQNKILQFQYSATTPQLIQFIDFAPSYPVVDPTLCIISRCSVTTNLANTVQIKVAKLEPPQALTSPELGALQSYVNAIGAAGVDYLCISQDPDRLFVQADIYYLGQYGSALQTTVIQALNDFLTNAATVNFNGKIQVSDIERAILAVAGVQDVILQNVSARASGTAFGSGISLVTNAQVSSRLFQTVAGYMIGEDTAGETFADTLNFIPQ